MNQCFEVMLSKAEGHPEQTTDHEQPVQTIAHKAHVTEAGALVLSMVSGQIVKIYAPGRWLQVEGK